LHFNENAIRRGAQTERPDLARPVRTLLGGRNSPASFAAYLSRHDSYSPLEQERGMASAFSSSPVLKTLKE